MATRQRGTNSRASASKQQPGSITVPAPAATSGASPPAASVALTAPEAGTREQRIATSAYLRAAERGFMPGHELEDWLAAERELEASEIGLAAQRQ